LTKRFRWSAFFSFLFRLVYVVCLRFSPLSALSQFRELLDLYNEFMQGNPDKQGEEIVSDLKVLIHFTLSFALPLSPSLPSLPSTKISSSDSPLLSTVVSALHR
jgi:hypothetical protein